MGLDLRTRICEQLGITYPILSVGFGDGASPELVAAVSNAGGFGVLGSNSTEPSEIRSRITSARRLTNLPFGFNLIIAASED